MSKARAPTKTAHRDAGAGQFVTKKYAEGDPKTVHRDAGDGRFLTKKHTENHPKTTTKEKVRIPPSSPITTVNMLDAKTTLSKLVEAVESGQAQEIIISRNGKPAARLVPIEVVDASKRIGIAKGKFVMPDDWDADNEEIAKMFYGDDE